MDGSDVPNAEKLGQICANAAYLYPNYSARLSVITRAHWNADSPFDADALHTITWSAIIVAGTETAFVLLVEAATAECPLAGKLRTDYHTGCHLGSRKGAIDALLLKTEMMIDAKIKEDEASHLTRRNTVAHDEARKQSVAAFPSGNEKRLRQMSWSPTPAGINDTIAGSVTPSRRASLAQLEPSPARLATKINRGASVAALEGGPVKSSWLHDGGETGVGSWKSKNRSDTMSAS